MVCRAEQKLTRRQKRLSEKGQDKELMKFPTIRQLNMSLSDIGPVTDNQIEAFQHYNNGNNICLHGCAGTGKTFLSMYLALKQIEDPRSPYKKLIIIRPPQASKNIGFLPGTEKQKLEVYEAAYKSICGELYRRGDAYDILTQKGIIEFTGTSFYRGTTVDDAIILVDEFQNMNYMEARTILTRPGDRARVILCGDTNQDDLSSERYKETSCVRSVLAVLEKMNSVSIVHFTVDDIVRSGFVRDFIIAEKELGLY